MKENRRKERERFGRFQVKEEANIARIANAVTITLYSRVTMYYIKLLIKLLILLFSIVIVYFIFFFSSL